MAFRPSEVTNMGRPDVLASVAEAGLRNKGHVTSPWREEPLASRLFGWVLQ
jgi:hypothetical protein